ncbi:MAG: hypothetical protein PVI57_09595, partial [Gemmatimonadota bacterium]
RVHDFRRSRGEEPRPPSFGRPPPIREIWHNALFELVGDDVAPRVQIALIASADILASSASAEIRDLASRIDDLATGERSAMELSRRISDRQLGIPRNRPPGELMLRDPGADPIEIGPVTLRVLGPSRDDLERLRASWLDWLDDHRTHLAKLQAEMLDEEDRLGTLESAVVARPLLSTSLGEGVESVTEPNLASLMLFVEEGDTTVLLTGDGVSEEILTGLEEHGLLDDAGAIHVDVLKVQHHGATANVEERFVDAVTADHYLFCGNGAHDNPELEVVEAFARRRRSDDRPFTFWFSAAPDSPGLTAGRRAHMREVHDLVDELVGELGAGRMSAHFLRRDGIEIRP